MSKKLVCRLEEKIERLEDENARLHKTASCLVDALARLISKLELLSKEPAVLLAAKHILSSIGGAKIGVVVGHVPNVIDNPITEEDA